MQLILVLIRYISYTDMKKILLILTILCISLSADAALSATGVLDKAASVINGAKALTAEYTIKAGNSKENGSLLLASGKFTMKSPSLQTWYDGITMWTYSPSLNEVNISTPTADELMEINPFAIVNSYKSAYTPHLVKSDKNSCTIELTPKSKGRSFSKAIVVVNTHTYYPLSIQLTMTDGSIVDVAIQSVKTGAFPGNEAFRFKKSAAPNAEIIDLR